MNAPKKDKTPAEVLEEAVENLKKLSQYSAELARYRRSLYLEYVAVGFTEVQALELVKGALM